MGQTIINGTKVTMGVGDNCLFFRTFSRQHPRSSRFLVVRKTLSDWLEGDKGELYDSDLGNFLRLQKRGENLLLSFTWLSGSDDRIYGHKENVTIPASLVRNLLECEAGESQYLCVERAKLSRFDFSHANQSLTECLADKQAKRALSKALRNLTWRDTTVTMFNDGCPKCFFFREQGSWTQCGGLILHKGETFNRGRGKFPKVYYSVHT